jgi:uncharacterized membrane protein
MKILGNLTRAVRYNVLLGLFLVTPLVVTLYIVNVLYSFLAGSQFLNLLSRLLPASMRTSQSDVMRVAAQIAALAMALMLLFLLGFFVRSFFGKRLYNLGEQILGRIPVFNKIYIWVRQIGEAFVAQRQTLFKEVVLVEYPRRGIYSVAFVTAPVPSQVSTGLPDAGEGNYVSLFVPTTPNPTSGLMIVAPRRELVPLPMSVADAMKFVISAGAVHPGQGMEDDRPTLIDKLELWLARDTARGDA